MLNYIWLGLAVFAVVVGGWNNTLDKVTKMAFENAGTAVTLLLGLVGIMALWLGVMRLAEKSGMVQLLARALKPLMKRLFPDVPPDHPAMGSMVMNMAANMLGLSNAATPLGIRAMEDLESLNPRPGTATNAMCTFLAINTASIQLIPVTVIAIFEEEHAKDPSGIIGPAFLATVVAAICAVIGVKLMEKLPFFRLPPVTEGDLKKKQEEKRTEEVLAGEAITVKPLEWWGTLVLVLYFLFFAFVFIKLSFPQIFSGLSESLSKMGISQTFVSGLTPQLSPEMLQGGPIVRMVKVVSLLAVPILLSFFPIYAALRRIKVYDEFVEGAKEGFQVCVRIIPNLVAILVAIGMFRGAGGIEMLTNLLGPTMHVVHFPPELLPMALIRPLTGSGSLAVFTDTVKHFGPDNILSKMAGTIYGSTETTFYVLAVYFGAVGIRKARHAVPAGLVADIVAIISSVVICRMMFS